MVDVESAEIFKAPVDLASRWLGASVIAANDESFGAKENLINPGRADFKPGNYGHSGEIVDGWETRRRRGEAGQDWVIVRLGCPGVIREIDVDTSFFTGNYPERCSLEACGVEGYPSAEDLRSSATEWIEIVPRSALRGDCSNMFEVNDYRRFTHVRLNIDPDGGVARLRVKGEPIPDPRFFDSLSIDLVKSGQRRRRHTQQRRLLLFGERTKSARSRAQHGGRVGDPPPARQRLRLRYLSVGDCRSRSPRRDRHYPFQAQCIRPCGHFRVRRVSCAGRRCRELDGSLAFHAPAAGHAAYLRRALSPQGGDPDQARRISRRGHFTAPSVGAA